jgi:FdhD protein
VASPVDERAILRMGRGGDDRQRDRDPVVVEAPLELRARDGRSLVVTMRTPTGDDDDLELARGLLHAEGVLDAGEADRVRRADPTTLAPDEVGNVVEIDLDAATVAERWPPRSLAATSACGVCGKASIAALELRAQPVASDLAVPAALVAELPDRVRAAQHVFAATGGLHAAAVFSASGDLLAVREDVGRHNAVDKIVGWAMAAGRLPLSDVVLCVSGRLGFEIAQKAVVAGCPVAVAVSAPSTLAIDLAERFRLTLCGFTRGGRFNVYSHPARIA